MLLYNRVCVFQSFFFFNMCKGLVVKLRERKPLRYSYFREQYMFSHTGARGEHRKMISLRTLYPQSIHVASLFPDFVMLQSYSSKFDAQRHSMRTKQKPHVTSVFTDLWALAGASAVLSWYCPEDNLLLSWSASGKRWAAVPFWNRDTALGSVFFFPSVHVFVLPSIPTSSYFEKNPHSVMLPLSLSGCTWPGGVRRPISSKRGASFTHAQMWDVRSLRTSFEPPLTTRTPK